MKLDVYLFGFLVLQGVAILVLFVRVIQVERIVRRRVLRRPD